MVGRDLRLSIIFGLFIGLMIGMNVLGAKIIPIGPFSASVAFLIVPLSFLATDIVNEVYGKKVARQFVISGVITLALFLGILLLFVALPPHARFTDNEAYSTIFGTSARIVFASIVAFLVSQFHDVWSFGLLKRETKGNFLWFRTNVSTLISMIIDTFVFMFLAFYMLTPKFTAGFVLELALPYLMFKMAWGVVSSPLVYAGAGWLRGSEKSS